MPSKKILALVLIFLAQAAYSHTGNVNSSGCHAGEQQYHCHGAASQYSPAQPPKTISYTAKVIGISDGDTIKVLRNGTEQVKIRLAGIDCPEKNQPWGKRAKQIIGNLVAGKTAAIEVMDIDRYGRTVGRVFVDEMNINRLLVSGGHCWVYKRYAKDKALIALQDEALADKRGLWNLPDEQRVPPWEWRKAKRK